MLTNEHFSDLIQRDPNKALKLLYSEHYELLCNSVYMILRDRMIAEDIVQEVITTVWKNRESLTIQISILAYLRRACRNKSLNYIRDNKIKFEDESTLNTFEDTGHTFDQYKEAEELNILIQDIISKLPEKCGIIFSLSRFEDMSYAEISKDLGISTKTVEHQISKALRILREEIFQKQY